MAIAGSQVANYGRHPMGNGKWFIWGTITGPALYTSGGEVITKAVASSLWGVKDIQGLSCSPAGDTTWANGAIVNFQPTPTDTTNAGEFHFYVGGVGAHTHDISIIGGQSAAATDTVFCPAATDLLGKQEAGDALVLGADVATKGGIVATTAVVATAEAAASTVLETYTFFVQGVAAG